MNQRRALLTITLAVLLTAATRAGVALVIPCLSGFVRDNTGVAVVAADLDFIVPATGVKLVTPGDNTDASGFYNVCVLPGVYDVSYAPPPGTRLMGRMVRGVDMTADVGKVLDITLNPGDVVSGRISDGLGASVGDVDVDVDAVSGGRVFTPDDNSDPATGTYRVVVPSGLYRLRYEPPFGSRLRGAQVDSVSVNGDVTLDVVLQEGLLLSGRVRAVSGDPIFDVDIDLRDQFIGEKVFLAGHSTDVAGNYSVAAPSGTYELRFSPPRGSHFVAARIDSFTIAGDRQWDQDLEPGVKVSIEAVDTTGAAIQRVDVDVKVTATSEKLYTPNDNTDAAGRTDFAVIPGMYTLQFDPPLGTTFDQLVLDDVSINTDTTIVVVLKEVARRVATGRVVDGLGAGVAGTTFEGHIRPGGARVYIPVDITDDTGSFSLAIPIGSYDMFVAPPQGSRFVARKLFDVTVDADSAWGEIALDTGWFVDVDITGRGRAVVGADLDVHLGAGEVYTPRDNTDATGHATVVVPSGDYSLLITPPPGSGFAPLEVTGFTVGQDTAVAYALESIGNVPVPPVELLQNYPNPFRDITTIPYALGQPGDVTLSVYNVAGQLVKVIESGPRDADAFTTSWDGTDRAGARVATGVYFLRLETTMGNQARKIVIIR